MRSRSEAVSLLMHPGIIAVIRTSHPEQIPDITQALRQGGVLALEITLTVPQAVEAIRQTARSLGTSCLVGAGSVLHAAQAQEALDAGAEFLVSPAIRPDIISIAHAADRPVMLGAYTPTEAQTVHELGADFVKLFPADQLGPAYVKAIRAPLPHLRIVPTGGVDLVTAPQFIQAGCVALGVGSSLLTKEILAKSDWAELTRLARAYVEVANQAR